MPLKAPWRRVVTLRGDLKTATVTFTLSCGHVIVCDVLPTADPAKDADYGIAIGDELECDTCAGHHLH